MLIHPYPQTRPKFARLLALVSVVGMCLGSTTSWALGDWKDDIGYTQLVNSLSRTGLALPNGSGVPISIVESGGGSNAYWPDTAHSDFSAAGDPLGTAVTFIDGSNQSSKTVSNHATSQSRIFFGNTTGVAPAANNNVVTVYEASNWLSNILHAPNGIAPATQNFRVQNFSWVGSFENVSDDVQTLRRFDFLINRDNITAMVGINNNTDPLPNLLGQAYNAIAVGRTDGIHSTGLTNLANYGLGRSKPDLVSPWSTSSAATSSVSSVATMLHSGIVGTNANKSQVMKAILMAGATKTEFPGWSRSTTQPLDDTFGAGEVNAFNSYLMTLGGRYAGSTSPSSAVGSHGWDFQSVNPGAVSELKYNFVVPTGSTATELSVLLTWNVNVASGFTGQTLANLNLKLTNSLGQIVDQSLSTVDNVEHLYLTNLAAGNYTLSVSTDTPRDFGLAWRMSTLFDVPTADFDDDGDVDGRDFLTWQRGFGKLINASHAEGDANGDGAVDQADLAIYQQQFPKEISNELPALLAYAVPEPASAVFAAGGLMAFLLGRQRRSR